jgi:hypothetical protein
LVVLGDGVLMAMVGAVRSIVTALPLVVVVTGVPALPAISEKVTLNATTPIVSLPVTVMPADQLVPLPLTVAARPAKVTVGALIVSLAVKLSVITFPTFAHAVLVLLEAMVRVVNVGGVLSTLNVVLGPAAGAVLPAVSLAVPAAIEIPRVPSPEMLLIVTVRVVPLPGATAKAPLAVPVLFSVMFPTANVLALKFVSV